MQVQLQQAAPQQNDALKLENYERLLHQMARAALGRLNKAGVAIDYEDCFQEMCLGYAKAVRGFDPGRGFAFTTYLVRTCWQEFNRAYEKPIAERAVHGTVDLEDMRAEGEEGSELDFLTGMQDPDLNPEQAVSYRQQMALTVRCLSPNAKRVLREFLRPSEELKTAFAAHQAASQTRRDSGRPHVRVPDEITIGFVGRFLKIDSTTMTSVREELGRLSEIRY